MSFGDFYRAARQREPFPWMYRLAERFALGTLPDVIDLPTGSAKTEIVVIWAWAWQQGHPVPRRLWMASDRRVIADQTFEVARSALGDGIRVSRLRGGIVPDDEPMLDPVRPQVISTTIDQLGSRLLFRAYGSSPRSWPIWAGLAGNDSLIVLDEAHLSATAEDTMRACRALGADIRVISMTATPRHPGLDVFSLDEEDAGHPVLRRRLEARRIVELRQKVTPAAAAMELLDSGLSRVAVVCNTVRAARQAFAAIPHPITRLIIGRQRPLDRDRIMAELLPRMRSGSEPSEPMIVVATQCIEAGADFDFDGMVTEICPLDALRQRLGRLDRLGDLGESRCILIGPDGRDDIPPYGAAPLAAWKWLSKKAERRRIDLGCRGWAALAGDVPEDALSSRPEPVSFLEPHLRMLSRTSPRPRVEPDIDLLLHGPGRRPGDVSVVWRRDVAVEDPAAANEILELLPPQDLEACPVPLWELRAWLEGEDLQSDGGDVEGALEARRQDSRPWQVARRRAVLRWDGLEDGVSRIGASRLKPGDVVVLPSSLGGYDRFGWAPSFRKAVSDLAEEACFQRTGRRVERLADPNVEVAQGRARRWSGGVVVEHFTNQPGSPALPCMVTLSRHSAAVAARARADAETLGLDATVLEQAGLHHDAGKAHSFWQLNLKESRPGGPVLAKGTFAANPLSRLPRGWRHEAESLRHLPSGTSPLVEWLIATHHGYARPFWPIPEHGLGLAERMDELQRAFGYWRLALHEAVLRCADRSVSREEMGEAAVLRKGSGDA